MKIKPLVLVVNFFIFKKSHQKLGCVLYTGAHYTRVNMVNHVTTTLFTVANVGILGFHQSCDQNKNRNHSMKKVKSLRYDRWLIYKQHCQESGLCCFSFARYLQKCVTQIYRALFGDATLVTLYCLVSNREGLGTSL